MKEDFKIAYVDLVDYQHEIGEAAGGNIIYASANDLKGYSSCWNECGIAKVKVSLIEEVHPQDLKGCDEDYLISQEFLNHLQERKNNHQKIIERLDYRIKEIYEKNKELTKEDSNKNS